MKELVNRCVTTIVLARKEPRHSLISEGRLMMALASETETIDLFRRNSNRGREREMKRRREAREIRVQERKVRHGEIDKLKTPSWLAGGRLAGTGHFASWLCQGVRLKSAGSRDGGAHSGGGKDVTASYRGQVAGARGGMQRMNGAAMGAMVQGTKMVATRLK